MHPLKLTPAFKDYIWGGEKLKKNWNKNASGDIIAESWELSCNADGLTNVGEDTLLNILTKNPEYLGLNCDKFENFPILIKLIDSKTNLSIQVHPSDEYALKNEFQYGKTEMWYVVEADKGSGVYCGFKTPQTSDTVKECLKGSTICDVLNFIEVKSGDTLFIEAGTVHAICGGLLICEIQQNSSLTYRLFDYDRLDSTGNKRELHIEKSLNVINFESTCVVNAGTLKFNAGLKRLATCKYFTTFEITGDKFDDEVNELSFVALSFLTDAKLKYGSSTLTINKGESYFLPAKFGKYTLLGKDILAIKTII